MKYILKTAHIRDRQEQAWRAKRRPVDPQRAVVDAGGGEAGTNAGAGLLDGGVGGLLGSPKSSGLDVYTPSESEEVVSSATSLTAAEVGPLWCRREGWRGSMGWIGRGDGDGAGTGDDNATSSSPSWKGSGREGEAPVDMQGYVSLKDQISVVSGFKLIFACVEVEGKSKCMLTPMKISGNGDTQKRWGFLNTGNSFMLGYNNEAY